MAKHHEMVVKDRLKLLEIIGVSLSNNLELILDTLEQDLGRHPTESMMAEIVVIKEELKLFKRNLKKWLKPKKVPTPLQLLHSSSEIQLNPLGRVLIISPWNYPFHLSLVPAIGAIAAGNSVVIKPSELAPNSSHLLAKIINEEVKSPLIKVQEGGKEIVEKLLEEKFDKVFFTGSEEKGKLVYAAAAKQLTPVTLELGGKNPLIVDKTIDLSLVRRIVWGKFLNAGQTCLAPDYALVHQDIFDDFVKAVVCQIKQFYGNTPVDSSSLTRIINTPHFKRLLSVMDDNKLELIHGGTSDEKTLKIAPTLLKLDMLDFTLDEEIFGPILPIITYRKVDEIITFIEKYPTPLVTYVFSSTKATIDFIKEQIHCGAVSINDCLMHGANPNLPFGGIGSSGIGKYHGLHSLLCFSNQKTVFKKSRFFEISLKFPPYTKKSLRWLKKLI